MHGIRAVPFKQATHVLVDVFDTNMTAGKYTSNYVYFNTVVSAYLVCSSGLAMVYLELDQNVNPVCTELLAVVGNYFCGYSDFYYNAPSSLDNLTLGRETTKHLTEAPMDVTIDFSNLKVSKISGEHHIHFTAAQIYNAILENADPVMIRQSSHIMRMGFEMSTTFAAGLLLWLAELPADLFAVIEKSDLLDSTSIEEYDARCKHVSKKAKLLQNLCGNDLRPIFEAQVLVNRMLSDVDWEAEYENRVNPNLANVQPDDVYSIAKNVFQTASYGKARPRRLAWADFWKARWQWSAVGSVHSQYPEDQVYIPKEIELRNKFISLNMYPSSTQLDYFLSREPKILAKASTKYEWGKQRAIYGCDMTSYIISHFAFYNIEDTLPDAFPVGHNSRPSKVTAKISAILQQRLPLCIDFEDFNSQHSNDNMIAVLRAWLDVYRDVISPEQVRAVEWTIDSINHTHIIDNNSSPARHYKTRGTLMSGWRLTSFVNSVLNYIYTQHLFVGCNEKIHSVHNGDDVLAGITNLSTLQKVHLNAEKLNIRLSDGKSTFGGIAEFLRVDHSRGEKGQYLTRNVATLMHGRIESRIAISLHDVVESMENRFLEHLDRGGNTRLLSILRREYYKFMAPLYSSEVSTLYAIKNAHRVVHGISDKNDADVSTFVKTTVFKEDVSSLPTILPGVVDYGVVLHSQFDIQVGVDVIINKLHKATRETVQKVRKTVYTEPNENVQQGVVHRALYKAYSEIAHSSTFGKAALVGFVFDVLSRDSHRSAFIRMVGAARDPLDYIRVVV